MANKKPTKHQHYIPQVYLRKFTSTPLLEKDKRKIFMYDKTTQLFDELPVKRVAIENNIYAYDLGNALYRKNEKDNTKQVARSQVLENIFQYSIEPMLGQAINEVEDISHNIHQDPNKRILSDTIVSSTELSFELKEKLATSMVFQYFRTTQIKNNIAKMGLKISSHLKYWASYFTKNIEYLLADETVDSMNFHEQLSQNSDLQALLMTRIYSDESILPKLVAILLTYIWTVIITDVNDILITSDVPIQFIGRNLEGGNQHIYFGTVGSEVIFPLTSNIYLSLKEPQYFSQYKVFDGKYIKVGAGTPLSYYPNFFLFNGAERFVFSSKNSFYETVHKLSEATL